MKFNVWPFKYLTPHVAQVEKYGREEKVFVIRKFTIMDGWLYLDDINTQYYGHNAWSWGNTLDKVVEFYTIAAALDCLKVVNDNIRVKKLKDNPRVKSIRWE